MATEIVRSGPGVELRAALVGDGEPLVLVHGSFDDLHAWDGLVPELDDRFRVVRYDRRGHGGSSCPPGQGRIGEDVDDLGAVIDQLAGGAGHVAGHSYGATVAMLLCARSPERVRSLTLHEPPLFGLLPEGVRHDLARRAKEAAELIESGKVEDGVRGFVRDVGFGPGVWDDVLTPEQRASMAAHAGTWLDQHRDPERLGVDPRPLAAATAPITVTRGDAGLAHYPLVMAALHDLVPNAVGVVIEGAGHAPHLTHPRAWAAAVVATTERAS